MMLSPGGFAAADIAGKTLVAVTSHIGAAAAAADCTARGGHVVAAAATDLVTEDAADDAARNSTAYIRRAATVALVDLTAFHPATLLRRAHDGPHRGDARVVGALIGPTAVVIVGFRQGLR